MFIRVPIIGSGKPRIGSEGDPYRPLIPANISKWSADVPVDSSGTPIKNNAIVWIPDNAMVPAGAGLLRQDAIDELLSQPHRVDIDAMEQKHRTPRALLASDDFNRADENPIAGNWSTGYTSRAALRLIGNKVRATVASTQNNMASYNAVVLPNDQWGQITLATWTGSTNLFGVVLLRCASPPTDTYYQYVATAGPSVRCYISKLVAATETQFATGGSSPTWAVGDVLLATAERNAHTLYRNDQAILTGSDSAIASGRAGLLIYVTTLTNVELDNWKSGCIFIPADYSNFPKRILATLSSFGGHT